MLPVRRRGAERGPITPTALRDLKEFLRQALQLFPLHVTNLNLKKKSHFSFFFLSLLLFFLPPALYLVFRSCSLHDAGRGSSRPTWPLKP